MAKKKSPDKSTNNSSPGEEPKFVVKKRVPKEKPNFFQNIPSLRHPLAQIFDFPAPDSQSENSDLDIQIDTSDTPIDTSDTSDTPAGEFSELKIIDSLDSQATIFGYPKRPNPDSQKLNPGNPNIDFLDSQITEIGNPNSLELESQNQKDSYPKSKTLDSLIAEPSKRISKEEGKLDSKIADVESLDSQNPNKTGKWRKYDRARSRKGIFLRTDDELTKRFKQFCIRQELDFSQGTEIAWEKFMSDLDSQTADNLDSKIALNNKQIMMMSKSKPVIINLYYAYNQFFTSRVRWTAKDDRTAAAYNEVDPRIIELGIIQTQCNLYTEGVDKSTTINGFQYYANEIKRFMMYEDKTEILDTILKINRESWIKLTGKKIDYSVFDEKTESEN